MPLGTWRRESKRCHQSGPEARELPPAGSRALPAAGLTSPHPTGGRPCAGRTRERHGLRHRAEAPGGLAARPAPALRPGDLWDQHVLHGAFAPRWVKSGQKTHPFACSLQFAGFCQSWARGPLSALCRQGRREAKAGEAVSEVTETFLALPD